MILTVYDLLCAAAARTPDQAAIVDTEHGRTLTYRDLLAEIDGVAAALAASGVRRGTRVATVLPNSVEHALVILALARLGAVGALMSPRLAATTVAGLLGRDEVTHVVIPPDADMAAPISRALPAMTVLTVGGATPGATALEPRRDQGALPVHGTFDGDDPTFILYTSGTTALPKGVILPQRTTLPRLTVMATQGNLRFGSHNRVPGVLPLSHVMGLHGTFLATLAFNGTYFMIPRWDAEQTATLIDEHKLTFLLASPTHIYDLLEAVGSDRRRLASLQAVSHTGAPISPALLQRLAGTVDAPIGQMYGSTEMMNSLYADRQTDVPQLLRPGFLARVRVVEPGGTADAAVARGDIGELIVAMDNPGVFAGYLNQPEETARKVQEGWFRTGDAACELEGDMFLLQGRCDDMILSGGENIFPQEVEQTLEECSGVREAVVLGVDHARWGQVPIACVETDGSALSSQTLDAHCRASDLPNFKRPRHYLFMDALPRNAMEKVMRQEVRSLAQERLKAVDGFEFDPSASGVMDGGVVGASG